MDPENFDEAFSEFWDDLLIDAEASGEPQESIFFKIWSEMAAENGDCLDLNYAPARRDGQGGYRIDGYALDSERGELHLAICDLRSERTIQTSNSDTIARHFTRMQKFFELATQSDFVNSLEEVSPAFDAAFPIFSSQSRIKRIRGILFTNSRIAMRKKVSSGEVLGRPITYNLLDFSRFLEIQKSHQRPEHVEIDISELNGKPLPCLEAHVGGSKYQSFLIVIPGELLAKIYGLYGARLLEQNVRTFLQARTKVNRGIINTIDTTPEMFFAFNNGLTATAEGVELMPTEDGNTGISLIRDLQIVNGGQTTASILYASDRNKANLSSVFVQMKLSVIQPDRVEQIVPLISRFANTQNRISEADFFSSHPFHLEMEKISRRLPTPIQPGSLVASKWFYERARGQYKDRQNQGTVGLKKKFDIEFPKTQTLQKIDIAKYEMTFSCKPHLVSQGAQKCFLSFADETSKAWEANSDGFNEDYFRRAIAKAILFRWTDQMIGNSEWYRNDRGYKAETVTYTLAWLANFLSKNRNSVIDYLRIWKMQAVPEEIQQFLVKLAPRVAEILKSPPPNLRNVREYAKQQGCWARISNEDLAVPDSVDNCTVDKLEDKSELKTGVARKKEDKGIEFETNLLALSAKVGELESLGRKHRLLSPKSAAALEKLRRNKVDFTPSDLNALKNLFERLQALGVDMAQFIANNTD